MAKPKSKTNPTPVIPVDNTLLTQSMNEITKEFGKGTIRYGVNERPVLNTGSIQFDYLIDGGYETGTFAMYYGLPGSGKTSLALRNIAAAQRQGKSCALLRIEKGCSKAYMTTMGVDIDKLIVIEGLPHGEAYLDSLVKLIQSNIDLIVVDSISALSPQDEINESLTKQTIALQARLLSRAARKLQQININSIVILISQVRQSPNPRGFMINKPSGGNAIWHMCDYRVEFKLMDKLDDNMEKINSDDLKDEDRMRDVTGATMRMFIEKTRRGTPNRAGKMYFNFKTGKLDTIGELLNVATHTGDIKVNGGWIEFNGTKYHLKALRELLTNNKDVAKALITSIYTKYGLDNTDGVWLD